MFIVTPFMFTVIMQAHVCQTHSLSLSHLCLHVSVKGEILDLDKPQTESVGGMAEQQWLG